jgi:hypothetical protein
MEMVEMVDAKISEPETFNPEMSELFGKVNGFVIEEEKKDNLDVLLNILYTLFRDSSTCQCVGCLITFRISSMRAREIL